MVTQSRDYITLQNSTQDKDSLRGCNLDDKPQKFIHSIKAKEMTKRKDGQVMYAYNIIDLNPLYERYLHSYPIKNKLM